MLPLMLSLACTGQEPDTEPQDTETETPWQAPQGGVVTMETRDGVLLEADYLPSETEGARSILLLHMIPPNATRADWPQDFQQSLSDQGWTVLAVDRRGAGGSGGTASDAYEGEYGRYDVEACAKLLQDDGYGELAIIAASNGTTSMVDYASWAAGEGLPEPVALAYMSGGAYTENQTAMEQVPKVPMAFLYPPNEAGWAEGQSDLDPGSWEWHSYEGGQHGTRLFSSVSDGAVEADLLDFLLAN